MKLKALSRQTLVITGATSGIGLATAREASGAGARVVLVSRDDTALEALVAEFDAAGRDAVAVTADVGKEEQVQEVAERALKKFGGFDTWINNAGATIYGRLEDLSLADHKRLFDTNYWGVVNGSLAALPQLRKHGGALINMGSMLSDVTIPLQGAYNASKHAIKGFTDSLRMELLHEKAPVSVTLVKPASVDTPLDEHARNYLPVRPVLPPPFYTPRLVAQAILQAAQHPIRDLPVGGTAELFRVGSSSTAPITDRVLGALMFPLQETSRTRSQEADNLYESRQDGGRERGNHAFVLTDSHYTRCISSPTLNRAGNHAATLLAAPWVRAGRLLSLMTSRR